MRLICPNCGAQYEVPDDVIPENGRDVQCSNCGDTWFQKHPSRDRELAEDLGQPLDEAHWDEDESGAAAAEAPGEARWEDADVPGGEAAPADVEPETAEAFEDAAQDKADEADDDWDERNWTEGDVSDADWAEDDADEAGDAEDNEAPAPRPRELSPEVRDVLREEAGHEMQARASDAGGLETQPDLGLDASESEASRREREARQRMARMRGLDEKEAGAGTAAAATGAALSASASRRDLLPDIDEINSTLRRSTARGEAPDSDEANGAAQPERKAGGGMRRGFVTVIVIAAVAILLYVYAGRIADAVPALGGVMEGYVAFIDRMRAWLDGQVLSVLGWLDGMSTGADPAAPMTEN